MLDICIPCRENHLSPKSGCKDLEPNAYFDEVRRFELLNVLVMLYSRKTDQFGDQVEFSGQH